MLYESQGELAVESDNKEEKRDLPSRHIFARVVVAVIVVVAVVVSVCLLCCGCLFFIPCYC